MNIVIVDDNQADINILRRKLERYFPYSNIEYHKDNFSIILKKQYDICFMDIKLVHENGIQLSIKYGLLYPKCKIIFVSNDDGLVYPSLEAKLFYFVRKGNLDFDLEKFHEKYKIVVKKENKIFNLKGNSMRYIDGENYESN